MLQVKNILVPVDFSEQTIPMIKYAQTIASRENASIHLIYVNEMVQMAYSGSAFSFGLVSFTELEDHISNWADEQFEKLLAELDEDIRSHVHVHHIRGRIADEIISFADNNHIDLIVMATHSRTALEELFLGSKTERVIHLTHTPMVVMRDPKTAPLFPPKHILVTTDLSHLSGKVFEPIVSLAKKYNSKITVLSIDSFEDGFLEKLDPTELMLLKRPFEPIIEKVTFKQERSIHAVNGIADYLEQNPDIDMVAMSTHGRTGLSHIMLGSTTEAIVRKTSLPVFVIRSNKE
jgi:nucleotide-binding universal stress UspA family protein